MNDVYTHTQTELNEDYSLDETVIRFDACERRKCLMVPIVDDLLLENTENFTIHLEKSLGLSNEFIVEPSVKVINIVDNDGTYLVCT